MTEFARVQGVELPPVLEDESLCEWIATQRWYASKSRTISSAQVVESIRQIAPVTWIGRVVGNKLFVQRGGPAKRLFRFGQLIHLLEENAQAEVASSQLRPVVRPAGSPGGESLVQPNRLAVCRFGIGPLVDQRGNIGRA